jgi:hypothetical protein
MGTMLLGIQRFYGVCGLVILLAAVGVSTQLMDPVTYEQQLAQRAAEQKVYDDAMASVRSKYAIRKDPDGRRQVAN